MKIECTAGLFIGVVDYQDEWLASSANEGNPGTDAENMAKLFKSGCLREKVHWEKVVRDTGQAPTRSAILKGARRLAKNVPNGSYGVLYFAGHAIETSRGLILMGEDFQSILPFDSGVPLARLVSMLCDEARRDACFLFILDCCRRRLGRGRSDRLP